MFYVKTRGNNALINDRFDQLSCMLGSYSWQNTRVGVGKTSAFVCIIAVMRGEILVLVKYVGSSSSHWCSQCKSVQYYDI